MLQLLPGGPDCGFIQAVGHITTASALWLFFYGSDVTLVSTGLIDDFWDCIFTVIPQNK